MCLKILYFLVESWCIFWGIIGAGLSAYGVFQLFMVWNDLRREQKQLRKREQEEHHFISAYRRKQNP